MSPNEFNMHSINLSQLMSDNDYDIDLMQYGRMRNISGMSARLADGACATSLANVLHYFPEYVSDFLEATISIAPDLREKAQKVLGAMCKRLHGSQFDTYRVWIARQAAIAAIDELEMVA